MEILKHSSSICTDLILANAKMVIFDINFASILGFKCSQLINSQKQKSVT